jgi:hypothetical protein
MIPQIKRPFLCGEVTSRAIFCLCLQVGKPEGKSPLGRPRSRCVDNIKMNLSEVGLGRCGLDWSSSG